jgi:hypothetical protein
VTEPERILEWAARLRQLAADVPAGPWRTARSADGEALILWDEDEPLALIYAGHDFARYLEACAPTELWGPT